jgi:putative spermidine/putrescine transport system permease protein
MTRRILRARAIALALASPGLVYLLALFGLPLLMAVAASFGIGTIGTRSAFTLAHWQTLLSERVYRDAVGMSLYLAFVPTLAALLLSVPLAAALQSGFAGRRLFTMLYKIPLVVPSIVAAFVVMTLFDRGGLLSRLLAPAGIAAPQLVRDPWALGAILAMTWKNVPFMTLIIADGFASISDDLRHAARSLGASRVQAFLRVDLPLALPAISAATILVVVTSIGAFAIPSLLGPIYPQPLSTLMVENAFEENRWGLVSAMGTLLTLIACVALLVFDRLTRRREAAS